MSGYAQFKTKAVRHYNIYNVPDFDKFVARMRGRSSNLQVKAWVDSIFKNWLRTHADVFQMIVPQKTIEHPWTKFLLSEIDDLNDHHVSTIRGQIVVMPEPAAEWALEPYWAGELYAFRPPTGKFVSDLYHFMDFMELLPDRTIRYSVEELATAVEAWDAQLEKQKLMDDLTKGVEVVYQFPDRPEYVVKLVTPQSYRAEGAAMAHCVEDYIGRACTIYSIRTKDDPWPLLTVEVRATKETRFSYLRKRIISTHGASPSWRLEQVQRRFRQPVTDEHKQLLQEFLTTLGGREPEEILQDVKRCTDLDDRLDADGVDEFDWVEDDDDDAAPVRARPRTVEDADDNDDEVEQEGFISEEELDEEEQWGRASNAY